MNTVISVILSVISVVLGTKMLSVVWHKSLMRIIIVSAVCRLIKFDFPKDVTSVSEFEIWCASRLPYPQYKIGNWMTCSLCTAPYFAAACIAPALINLAHTDGVYNARLATTVCVFTFVVSAAWAMLTGNRSTVVVSDTAAPANIPTEVPPRSATHRLQKYRAMTIHDRQAMKTSANGRWNAALGFIQTTNADGARVISPANPGSMRASEAMRFFNHGNVLQFGEAARQLQTDYEADINAFKESGECGTCAPEAHVQHLYYDEVLELLLNHRTATP